MTNSKSANDSHDPLHPPLPDAHQPDIAWTGLRGASPSLALTRAADEAGGPIVVVAEGEEHAWRLEEELRFFAPQSLPVVHYPGWETLPYDVFSPHQDITSERLAALYRLPNMQRGLVVVSTACLLNRIAPRQYLDARALLIQTGEHFDPHAMRARLEQAGYRSVAEVQTHGEYALRGSIMDIFPMGTPRAFRIDLFDEEVDSIRSFDPETQLSIERIDEIRLMPGREFPLDEQAISDFRSRYRARFHGDIRRSRIYQDVSQGIAPGGIEYYLPLFFEETATLFDYLPANALLATFEGVEQAMEQDWQHIHERYAQRRGDVERPLLPPEEGFATPELAQEGLASRPRITLVQDASAPTDGVRAFHTQPPLQIEASSSEAAGRELAHHLENMEGRILITAESAGRREAVLDLLQALGITPRVYESWASFTKDKKRLGLCTATLEKGFGLPDAGLTVISEAQIYGSRPPVRQRRKKAVRDPETLLRDLSDLHAGSPIVHQDHGVGRFLGLKHMQVGGGEQELLTLEYADGDKLYVPVTQLHLIHRYTGADADTAPLHRLGNDRWEKARKRAAKRARDTAAELLEIHARRAARPGVGFQVDEAAYREFCEGFPFTETDDQAQAIARVLMDMAAPTPMDRVVCGDVGFGKTEVAMRAAFVAAHNGYQVCLLVPTTLLAQQHYQNFSDRFAGSAVEVASLSRLRTKKERDQVLARMESGDVDIVIGTHRLLQHDSKFKNLGLVIVDEEHRFGVRHKEKLKSLRAEVDLLTLTATPIPRTLNMSLAGLRELSIIATPPAQRLAVKTFVAEWDTTLISEAMLREIKRGGQVYFLHNQVETIERIARELDELVPEASVRHAHGQMRERELEDVMLDFYHRRFNVLVCTTIIESGIDVPSANTMIINRADRFGLAQLHQLRGRVGRSHHRAYAYLLAPPMRSITNDAARRLEAIEALEELGSGFTLATHDMEIRGAGELLGDDQSGQIQEVGFSLYSQLMERAVSAMKRGELDQGNADLSHDTEVDVGLPALLPEDYIPDVQMRLVLYKRISAAADSQALRELKVELIDRFGLLPDATQNLFRVTEMKLLASPLGIRKIDAGDSGARLQFVEQPTTDPERLIRLVQSHPKRYRFEGQTRLRVSADLEDPEARLDTLEKLLETLGKKKEPAEAC